MIKRYLYIVLFIISSLARTPQSIAAELEVETGSGNPYNPLPTGKLVVTKVKHFGVVCWKIVSWRWPWTRWGRKATELLSW